MKTIQITTVGIALLTLAILSVQKDTVQTTSPLENAEIIYLADADPDALKGVSTRLLYPQEPDDRWHEAPLIEYLARNAQ
ncbi:hypothetical protein FAZ15_17275 [Sphingobacterium olei]|uniref:Uncharacterized protein n=1 Tax=Sphingobacterium olei TaxID=2571155 RepID=A0A4U0NHT7_9SPHI|nr:hypothetical protein [Sphingobacterium olei]TJZ53776.1 hypothetical protein FAZ15_17275 [Sphingobacterium olei]